MKVFNFRLLAGIVFLFLVHTSSMAQVQGSGVNLLTRAQDTMKVCLNASLFTVELTNTSGAALTNVSLLPRLQEGIEFINNSAAVVSGAGVSITSQTVGANLRFPTIVLNTLPNGVTVIISYQARANCAVIPKLVEGKTNNETRIEYVDNSISYFINEPNGSESFNVIYPQLEPFIVLNEITTDRNRPEQRSLTVRNSGLGAAAVVRLQVDYSTSISPVSLLLGSVSLTPTSTMGTVREYLLDMNDAAIKALIGNGNGLLEQNESFVLTENVHALSCGRLETEYTSLWGCAPLPNPNPSVFQNCNQGQQNAVTNAYLNVTDGEPTVAFNRTVVNGASFCSGSKARVEYSFANSGSSNSPLSVDGARNLVFNMSMASLFTASNFQIKDAGGSWIALTGAPASATGSFTLMPGNTSSTVLTELDFDNLANDLGVGAILELAMDIEVGCPAAFATVSASFSHALTASFTYADNCGAVRTTSNFFNYSNTFNNAKIEGPPDLSSIQSEHYIFTNTWTTAGMELLDCSAGNFYSTIAVPVGYSVVSASWNGTAVVFTQAGPGELVTLTGGGYSGSYDVEFELDCDSVTSSDPMGALVWNMFHRCSNACACEQKLVSRSYEVFNHCPDCVGFHTESFQLERTTFGHVMPPSGVYTHADLAVATRVDRNTPGVRLDRVYEQDEFTAKATGRLDAAAISIYAHNRVHYELRYTSPVSINILEVLGGTFTIDNGSIQTFPAPIVAGVGIGGNVFVFDFILPGTGTISPGDQVDLEVRFRVRQEASLATGEFLLQRFRADLYGLEPDNSRQRCEDYGDALSVLKGRVENYAGLFTFWDCGVSVNGIDVAPIRFFTATQFDDFPNEFRPLGFLNNMTIKLPLGYRYTPNSAMLLYHAFGFPFISNNDATNPPTVVAHPTGDLVTFNRAPNWYVTETGHGWIFNNWVTRFMINMEPKCLSSPVCAPAPNYGFPFPASTASVLSLSSTGGFATNAFALTTPPIQNFSYNANAQNNRKAELNLIASGIKDGYQSTVSWPVQICNNASGNLATATNTWIAFEPQNASTIPLRVKNTDNGQVYAGTDTTFTYMTASGIRNLMVNVGTIPLNQCRNLEFTARYTNCVQDVIDNINVTSSWSCSAASIPQVQGHVGRVCTKVTDCEHGIKTGTLQLRYKTAGYQWTVQRLGPPKVNLCEDIPFELKLTSALTADMSDIDVWFELPPGISYVLNSGTYVYNGVTYTLGNPDFIDPPLNTKKGWNVVSTSGNTTLLDLGTSTPPLDLTALPGTRLIGQNDVLLKFNLKASCDPLLDAGVPVNFYTKGISNCNDFIPLQQQRKIQLLDDPDSIAVAITSSAFTGCAGNNTLTVALRNELDRVTQQESFTVVLPTDVSYVAPSTFTGVLAGLSLGEPTITGNTLEWSLPSGLAVGALGSVSFQTKLENDFPTGGMLVYTARTRMNGNATCVTDLSTCPLVMTTGVDSDTLPVSFPRPTAMITTSTGKDSICAGSQLDLIAALTYVNIPATSYTCNWTSANTNPATNCTVTVSPTVTTTYEVIIEDANHCKDTATKVITVLPLPSVVEVEVKGITCRDKDDGRITVHVGAASASASVALCLKLNNNVVATAMSLNNSDYTFTGLDEGDYTVEVRDTLTGCVKSIPINVPYSGPRIDFLCSSAVPCGETSSRVIFKIVAVRPYSNNQGDYTFRLLLNGVPVPIQLNELDLPTVLVDYNSFDASEKEIFIMAGQYPGSYVLELTDDSGCVITHPLVIQQLKFTASVPKSITELCYATEKRDVPVSVSSNETCVPMTNVVYQYQLYKFDIPLQQYLPRTGLINSTQPVYTFASLDTGSYKVVLAVTATGIEGCKDSLLFEMIYKSTFYIDTIITRAPLCHNTETGTACVDVKGGAGAISYQWIDPSTGEVVSTDACATGLEGGKTYTLLVTDENGCADPLSYPVTIPAGPPRLGPPIVNSIDSLCAASAQPFDVNLGLAPFQFDWHKIDTLKTSTGADSIIRKRSVFFESPDGPEYISVKKPMKKGYYRIYIIDANGCRDSVDHYFGKPLIAMQYQICMNWTTYTGEGPIKPKTGTKSISEFPFPVVNMMAFNEKVQECVDRQVNIAKEQYVQLCQTGKALDDELSISYNNKYEHITLYYYDRGGRLVKTVPPAGVALVNPPNNTATPAHTLVTTYEYNSLSQLVSQQTPDAGRTDFVNNDKGQLRYSQNARQALDNTFSYTNYDNLGRIVEVGQDNLLGSLASLDPLASQLAATRHENTQTVYTQPATGISYNGKPQRFLRNRVSFTQTLNQNGDREYTYYSYDPHGNVEWLIQDIQGFSRTSVAYEYDLISNKVLQAKFNEGRKDQFFHRYRYDEDNRITNAETSRDGIVWDKHASYQYYLHGPMKRTELGEDRVQGMDYTYTVQGWLKGINSPDLIANEDLGSDGVNPTVGFPQDQFSMSLGYFNGDYTASNAFGSGSYAMPGTRNLYNGNISSWTDKIGYASAGQYSNTLTGNRYTYDKLNRIRESEFGIFNNGWTMQTGNTGEYFTSYTYDPNGNLLNLRRNAYGGTNAMDNLAYHYIPGTNKLNHVDEQVVGASNGLMQDITDQDIDNYGYDAIGNLVKDSAEHIHVKWNVYGKVTEVIPDKMVSDQKSHLKFSYDPSGNRTKKQINRVPYFTSANVFKDTVIDPATIEITYYSRDASGTVMGIYERHHTALTGKPGYYNAIYLLKELPMYGSSRLGQIQLNDTIAVKVFKKADFDKVNFLQDGLERNTTLHNPIVAGYGETLFENATDTAVVNEATVYTYPIPGSLSASKVDFLGSIDNNLAVGEDSSGAKALRFYTVTASDYWGKENVSLVYDNTNRLMKGLDTNLVDAKAKNVVVKQPGINKNYYLFTRDTLGNLTYHKVEMSKIGFGTVSIPSGEITAHTALSGNSYGRHMAVVEDYINSVSMVYVTSHDTSNHKTTLIQIQIDEQGGIAQTPLYTYDSYDYNGDGELQLSPDGANLVVYNHKKAYGFFNHRNIEVITLALDASYKPLDLAVPKVYTYLYGNYPKGSVELSSTGEHVYFEQVSLVNFINGTDNKAIYRQNLVESMLDTLALQAGDLRRSETNYLYSFFHKQTTQNAWKDTLFFSTTPTATNTTGTMKGYLAYQPHKVLLKQYGEQFVYRKVGDKLYELNDHLGNVRVVVTDLKQPTVSGGLIVGLTADVSSYNNFYAFGMQQPGRTYVGDGGYRYGFNGKEKDDEIKGGGNSYDFGARLYDARLGRWLSLDPMQANYQGWSPYNFSMNNPLFFNDPDGRTPRVTTTIDASGNTQIKLQFNVLVTDNTKEQAGATHIKGNEQAIRDQFPTHTINNADGTTTSVSVEINFEYTTSDKAYNEFDKKNSGAALSLDYDPDLVFTDDQGNSQSDANYEGGGIAFGPGAEVGKIAHEIAHDIGFGDQYLQDKNNSGYALIVKGYLNTMMGSTDKFSSIEAKKIVDAVKEQNIVNAVVQPINLNKDLPVPGSTVEVYKDKAGTQPAKAKVSSGKFGSSKTRQGEIVE